MLTLTRETWDPPALDTAVSAAILQDVDAGGPGIARLFVPQRSVVFGRQDAVRPGFKDAAQAAHDAGYTPVLRLAGGRAAVFHEGTIALAISVAEPQPRETIRTRFELVAGAVTDALQQLGVSAAIGEVPGEYCPGAYSIHAQSQATGGERKLAGLGQRLARSSAHIGGVVVVEGAAEVNDVLVPVYRHLGYDWNPAATGAIDEHAPVDPETVIEALIVALAERGWPTTPGAIDQATVDRAQTIAPAHDPSDSLG